MTDRRVSEGSGSVSVELRLSTPFQTSGSTVPIRLATSSGKDGVGERAPLMNPREVVEEWIRRFNRGDTVAIAELYHEDAVNHQVMRQPVEGRAAIRKMFEQDFTTAEMTCIPEVIHEAGDVAILEWRDPLGLRGCGFFTVRDSRIAFQRGYWDQLSFLRMHNLPIK